MQTFTSNSLLGRGFSTGMKALALSAALIVSGCAKEDLPELRETPDAEQGGTELVAALNANGNVSLYLPDMYPAPLTEIPAVKLNGSAEQMLGAVEVALKNVDPDAAAITFIVDAQVNGAIELDPDNRYKVVGASKIGNGITAKIDSSCIDGDTGRFLIPLPAGEYRGYSLYVENSEGTILFGKSEEENHTLNIVAGEKTRIEAVQMCSDTRTTSTTATTRPWEKNFYTGGSTTTRNNMTFYSLQDNRYSKGQFLGYTTINGQKHSDLMQSFQVLAKSTHEGAIVYCHTKKVKSADGTVRRRNLRVVQCLPKQAEVAAAQEKQFNAMELDWFGHGCNISVEEVGHTEYIWIGCHGRENTNKEPSECISSQTFARFKFTGSGGGGNAVPVVYRTDITDLYMYKVNTDPTKSVSYYDVGSTVYQSPKGTADYPDIFAIEHRDNGRRWFKIYRLSDVKAAPKEYARIKNATNNNTTQIYARNIARCTPIASCEIDDSALAFNANPSSPLAFQGFDVAQVGKNKYRVYVLYGEGSTTQAHTTVYIATKEIINGVQQNFEYSLVKAFDNDGAQLRNAGYNTQKVNNAYYFEPEGIKVAREEEHQGLKVYIGFASKGSDGLWRANICKFSRY